MIIDNFGDTTPHNDFSLSAGEKASSYLCGWNTLRSILRPTSREGDEGLKQLTWYLWKKFCEQKRRLEDEY